jgi:hypothetical protein
MALLRVGIDSGSGGMDGPLFADGAFEFVPIPDSTKLDERTYGNQMARAGNPLSDFFPPARRSAMSFQSMHLDPEFTSKEVLDGFLQLILRIGVSWKSEFGRQRMSEVRKGFTNNRLDRHEVL